MGASQVAVTESYLSHLEGKLGGEQLCFTTFPVLGMCTTYSSSSVITDSAAAGTAIASGHKTNNGMLGVDAEGNPVQSVAQILKDDYGPLITPLRPLSTLTSRAAATTLTSPPRFPLPDSSS